MALIDNRIYTIQKSKLLYHSILIGSFAIAVLLMPVFKDLVIKYITEQAILSEIMTYIVAGVSAVYVIPEIGFFAVRAQA